ncbi:MAG: hypothetical protein CMI60_22295 [Parvibaculum sp.]|nr:hypothetical protein [Parvibaculum sp.]
MAIKYLSNINLDNNELKSFIVDNQSSNPTGLAGEGQLIYRTDTNELYYHTGSNTWVAISSGMVTWILSADSGTNQTINNGEIATINGESGFITTTVGATRKVEITMDDQITAATVAHPVSIQFNKKGQIIAASAGSTPITSFTISDTVTPAAGTQTVVNGNTITFAHNTGLTSVVSATDTVTYNLKLDDLPDMTQTWVGADEFIVLDGTDQKRKASSEIPINLLGSPAANLDINTNKLINVTNPTDAQDAATKAYVDAAVTGLLEFKGGFDGSTGKVAGTTDFLDSRGTQIACAVGDTYVVTVDGTFYTETVAVGDTLICQTATAAGAGALTDWITVQNNIGIATATTPGIASFPTAGGTTVTAAGAVSIKTQSGLTAATYGDANTVGTFTVDGKGIITGAADVDIAITASQVTDFCTEVQTCVGTNLNYAVDIGDGSTNPIIVTHNLGTLDVIVQLVLKSTGETIYADTVRNSTTQVTITTTTTLTSAEARILVTAV